MSEMPSQFYPEMGPERPQLFNVVDQSNDSPEINENPKIHFASSPTPEFMLNLTSTEDFDTILHSIKKQLERQDRDEAIIAIMRFAAELSPKTNYQVYAHGISTLNEQVKQARDYYHNNFFEDTGSINIDALSELYDATDGYHNQEMLQLIHYVANATPAVPEEYFKDAERITHILIADDLSNNQLLAQ